MQTGKGSVKVERSEPKGNLDGFLSVLVQGGQKRGRSTKRQMKSTTGKESNEVH